VFGYRGVCGLGREDIGLAREIIDLNIQKKGINPSRTQGAREVVRKLRKKLVRGGEHLTGNG